MTPRRAPSRSSFANALLGLLLGGLLACVLAAAGVSVLFLVMTYTSGKEVHAIPISGINMTTQVQSINVTATPTLNPTVLHSPTASSTPFQPRTWTPTPSPSPTPTATATITPSPTPTETPTRVPTKTRVPPSPTPWDGLPDEASVSGVVGYQQALTLSCESRSAVDWARYYGVRIPELDFQYGLPFTDNPNTGFVGDPRGERGMIPPNSYGVHAEPVARLLRAYGVKAQSYSGMDFQTVRRQIAAGNPVIAWVIGNVWTGYGSSQYTASDGETLTVAPYEHTVIVIAYTPNSVTVVDNDLIYSASIDRFLSSWSVLGNMAIIQE